MMQPDLTLTSTIDSRSLQRRWALTHADPVGAALPPYEEFAPSDLRIWWDISDESPDSERLTVYAWPAQRDTKVFAHWRPTVRHHSSTMPNWISELADGVYADLTANRTSPSTGVDDRWSHTSTRRWEVVGADPVPDLRCPDVSFIPGELEVWWSVTAGASDRENRYNIYAYPAGRDRGVSAQWSGTRLWYHDGMPDWVRELADRQYEDLAEKARVSAAGRRT